MRGRQRGGLLAHAWTRIRGALWPIPALAVAAAMLLGIVLPNVDMSLTRDGGPLSLFFGGGPSAARDVLAAIAGSLISVTGLVFSLTVVTLQLASSQYSPRLLQTFQTDRIVQLTLAQLAATFVYALTVLRTVRSESATETETAFVPRLAVTVAYVFAVGSVLALLFFLGHLARSLRVETMLRDVHDEASDVVARELDPDDGATRGGPVVLPPGAPHLVCADSSGFVIDVDEDRLVKAAVRADAVIVLVPRIGDPVIAGVPVAHVWQHSRGDGGAVEDVTAAVARSVRLAYERSSGRDVAYGLRKVTDIALRALSPGVNDPTTAVHALSHSSAMLGDLLGHPLTPRKLHDDDGTLRLVVRQWDAEALLEQVVEEPLQFVDGQPAVLRRLAALLRELAWRAPSGLVDVRLRDLLERVIDVAQRTTGIDEDERAGWRAALDDALQQRWATDAPKERDTPVATGPGAG